jgi:hypothetical protein
VILRVAITICGHERVGSGCRKRALPPASEVVVVVALALGVGGGGAGGGRSGGGVDFVVFVVGRQLGLLAPEASLAGPLVAFAVCEVDAPVVSFPGLCYGAGDGAEDFVEGKIVADGVLEADERWE